MPPVFAFQQPEIYERWWREIAACQNLILPVELTRAFKFVAVNAETMAVNGEFGVLGYASMGTFTIFVVESLAMNESLIKHEQTHILLGLNGIDQGKNWHPDLYFTRCGISRFFEE